MKGRELDNLLVKLGLKDSGTVFFWTENGFVDDLHTINPQKIGLHFDIQKKLNLIKPTAIYVFNNQPFILFFDLTNEKNKARESDIHKQVWSFDHSPVIFVVNGKDISIYNALNYIKNEEEQCLEKINLSNKERDDNFSFWSLQSGSTWKWLQDKYLNDRKSKKTRKRVNEQLFRNIRDVRRHLTDEKLTDEQLTDEQANSLILRLIFIRYLVDREVEINPNYISGETRDDRRKCFCELITQPKRLNELFKYLNERFNGVLFKNLGYPISKKQSDFLSNVFKGELQGKDSLFEGSFFEIFDFAIIPVELISGIYESLIDEETRKLDSAVYTPSFLVDYILNDTVDEFLNKSQTSDCKVFEVAVGSGIFLVQSLRKMIEKEKALNNGKIDCQKIKAIATNNLFGIDTNSEALKVTCFSIYIALLDYIEPKDLTQQYLFPNLIGSNLFEANFFDTEHIYNKIIKSQKLDFILGNPPWASKKNDKTHINWLRQNKEIVGRYEIAQSFLLRTKDFMQPETKVALVVTSTMFYNVSSTSKTFKDKFLTTYCVDKFFDLSPVRRLIFEEKNSPASIVYFRLPKNENECLENIVNHQSVKINYFLKHFRMLVVEKFDQKEIQQKHFIENDWMFKVALYGNVLDFVFLKKIKSCNNDVVADDFLRTNEANRGLGVIKISKKSKTPPKHYSNLVDFPIIENSDVKLYYTPISKILLKKDDVNFIRGRKTELFLCPKILLKEQCADESYLSVSYQGDKSVYVNGVSGISFEDESLTKLFYSYFLSDWLTYFLFLTSCSWGVATRPAIRFNDEFLSFPFVEPPKRIKTELINLVSQFLKPFEEYYKKDIRSESLPIDAKVLSKINSIIDDLYGIKGYDKDLIDYVLNVSRYQFQESRQQLFTKRADLEKDLLKSYADVYIQEFEKIYDEEFMQVEIYPLNHFIAMKFNFLDAKPTKKYIRSENKLEKEVLSLLANNLSISQITNASDPTKDLFIQKDIKGFEENSFYIIKPNEYKCWHRAMAWYDVAEFKEAIQSAELKRLNVTANND